MRSILHHTTMRPCGTHSRVLSNDATRVSPPSPKVFLNLQAADMEYQVDGESITPAELEADSRWIRAVKAHRAAAAHQPITSTLPSSTPVAGDFSTAEHHPWCSHSSSSLSPPSIPCRGLQDLLQTRRRT
ncbi:hypothetical protein MRX96_056366 [Rhipicephalus microplus]